MKPYLPDPVGSTVPEKLRPSGNENERLCVIDEALPSEITEGVTANDECDLEDDWSSLRWVELRIVDTGSWLSVDDAGTVVAPKPSSIISPSLLLVGIPVSVSENMVSEITTVNYQGVPFCVWAGQRATK